MRSCYDNIVLIGMPACGKSTLGVLLAKRTARDFVDTDVQIQRKLGRSLPEILSQDGVRAFRDIEERQILALDCTRTVIATGGSVVYSSASMAHLREIGLVTYLEVPLCALEPRIKDLDRRGVVRARSQSLADLFAERAPLYERYANLRVPCGSDSHEVVVNALLAALPPNSEHRLRNSRSRP